MDTQRYGGPFRGVQYSVDRDRIALDRLSGLDTSNVQMDPLSGCFLRRGGSQVTGDVHAALVGLFESKWSSKGRHMIELVSPSLTDQLPTHLYLVSNETDNTGTIGWRDTNTGSNRQLGQDMTASHYPSDAGTNLAEFIMPPQKVVPTSGNAIGMTRAVDVTQRKVLAPGSRRVLEMGDELFMPNFSGTPSAWNKRWNPTASGNETCRIRPWGYMPPAWIPDVAFSSAGGDFVSGDKFYIAVSYLYEDGSHGPLVECRPVGAIHTAGYGLVSVGAGGPFKLMTVTNLPIGEDGVVGRHFWRSPKVTTGNPNIRDMRLLTTILDNTTTTFTWNDGLDFGLEPQYDKDLVNLLTGAILRRDYQWCPRARLAGRFDERAAVAYVRPNPGAFTICQKSGAAGAITANVVDTAAVSATVLSTCVRDDHPAAKRWMVLSEGGTENKIDLSGLNSVQDLIDTINETVTLSASHAWRSQPAPGSPVSASVQKLEVTQVLQAIVANGTTLILAADTTSIQVGMKVSGAGVTAGATVVSMVTNVSVTLSASVTAGAKTLIFGWDFGDAVYGEMRSYSPSYQGVHYFAESYLATFPTNKRELLMTAGGPTDARNAPRAFFASTANRKLVPADAGQIMGIAAIDAGSVRAIIPCARGIYKIVNYRGGGTGDDADYRMAPHNPRRGCIAYDSILELNGAVGYMTEDGYVVTAGQGGDELVISLDVWNMASGRGAWSYEVQQCRASAAKDGDDEQFHVGRANGKLFFSFRTSQSQTYPDAMIPYDYSPGLSASGTGAVLASDGQPYGWGSYWQATNASARWRPGPMCVIRKDTGALTYFYDESNAGSTGDGRVQQFNLGGYTDDGFSMDSYAYLRTDRLGSLLKKIAHCVRGLYTKGVGLPVLMLYRSRDRTDSATLFNFGNAAVGGVGAPLADRFRVEVPLSMRSPSDLYEVALFHNDGSGSAFSLFELEIDYETVNAPK